MAEEQDQIPVLNEEEEDTNTNTNTNNNANNQQQQEEKVDIWEIAQKNEQKSSDSKNQEKTMIVIGDSQVGKSQVIDILKERKSEIKPTSGIDYTFIKKSYNSAQIINIYEIAGGRALSHMIPTFINNEKIQNCKIVLIVDLSKPLKIIDSMQFWFDQIRQKVSEHLDKDTQNTQAISEAKYAFMEKYQEHPDRTRIEPLPVETIVICSKSDLYDKYEAEKRKWVARCIRFFAHVNGASVLFSNNDQTQAQNQLRGAVSALYFEKDKQDFCQSEHLKQILISFPQDQVAKIGLPPGHGANVSQNLQQFQKKLEEQFSQEDEQKKKDIFTHYAKFSEQKIDSLKLEKDREMERITSTFLNQQQY